MGNLVYYHHPDDHQYSLTYVSRDRSELSSPDGGIIEHYEFDDEFFVLYTDGNATGTVADVDDDFGGVLDTMPQDIRVITVRFLQIFEGVVEEMEAEEGEKLRIYKQIEVEKIPDALEEVEWTGSAVAVAAQLLSTLVLKHTLPNANHRTSIGLAEWYLESAESGFSLPSLATDEYSWKSWVDTYITESKRVLTVRRNVTAFSLLQEWGCEVVKRKGGIEIPLREYALDMPQSEAYQYYAERHTDLCEEFVRESVERAGHDELLRMGGPTKSEFAVYLNRAK